MRVWDGEYVVLNSSSADTHYLDAFSGEVLLLSSEGPMSEEEILKRLAATLETAPADVLLKQLQDALAALSRAGLIEPARP